MLCLIIFMITYEPLKILLQIGPFSIKSWGFMFVVAFLTAFFLILREAKKRDIDERHVYMIAILFLLGAIIGPRLFFIVEHLNYFIINPSEIFQIWRGGETSYGSLLSLFFIWLYIRKQKDITFLQILDIMAPYLLLAIAIGRIGCFLNWDDYGIQSALPWAIQTSGDIARHPTQLYESLYCLLGFFKLQLFKKLRKRKNWKFKALFQKQGSLFFSFLMFYSFFRFLNDFLRVYEHYFLGLALSQWFCIGIFIVSFVLLKKLNKKT